MFTAPLNPKKIETFEVLFIIKSNRLLYFVSDYQCYNPLRMLGELEKRVGYCGGELMEVAAGFFRKLVLMYSLYRLNARNFHKQNNGSNRFKIV